MVTINLQNLQEGHVVAKDIIGRNNAIIVPAGTIIQAKHFRILKIWGVQELEVTLAGDNSEISLNQVSTTLDLTIPLHMKLLNPENPFVRELIMIYLKRTSQISTEEKNGSP